MIHPIATLALSDLAKRLSEHAKNLGNFDGSIVLDLMILSLFLMIGTILRNRIPFFSKFLVPSAIVAGFVGLLLGPQLLNLVPINSGRIERLIYHLMTIGFIALAMKEREKGKTRAAMRSGPFIVSTYLVQAIFGFAVTLFFIFVLKDELFPTFGFLLALGYGQGPGQALALGQQWEKVGFELGTNTGLMFATVGYLWASFAGILYMNYLVRVRKMKPGILATGKPHDPVPMLSEQDRADDTPLSESIDRFTIQCFLIGVTYLLTYLTVFAVDFALRDRFGTFGTTFANMIQGFAFIIGSLYGLLVRIILDALRHKGILKQNYPNNYLLQRIAGLTFDYMVCSAIIVLSFAAIARYWLPALIIMTGGGFLTLWWISLMGRRVYQDYTLENLVGFFGTLTGTISSGMALVREVDPEFRSDAANNMVLGSGSGLAAGFPLLILINLPVQAYLSGNTSMYFISLGIFLVYLGFLILLMRPWKNRA